MPGAGESIFITSPLEPAYADRIRAAAPPGVRVIHEPDLLPVPRYVADHKGSDDFRRSAAQEARWQANLARATILWDFPAEPLDEGGGLALAPNVRWVQTTSSGVGQLVHKLGLADSDVIVTTARGIHALPLAEFVMMALLIHTKRLFHLQREQKAHRWERYCGLDLPGRTMTVVGAGKVGSAVGRIAKAFGMHVIAVVNRPALERRRELHCDEICSPEGLAEAVGRADCVTVCVPHTPRTERMISRDIIARMKPGVTFVNIARGQVVDEPALIEALRTGHIGFAALDVAEIEPLPPTSPLWKLPNVLVSPHSASTVESENARLTDIFVTNLHHYLAGRPDNMINVLDKKAMY